MRLKAGLAVAITMIAVLGGTPIRAEAQLLSEQAFSGFSTGTQVSVNAVQIGQTQVANVQEAFAGASVNSQGLGTPITNEMGQAVQPALGDKAAYGRGTGLELGALTNFPDAAGVNQLLLSGLAQASSPPPQGVPDPITRVLGPVDIPPLLFAGLLRGQAQAIYEHDVCAIGQPISYGNGEAANAQVVPSGPGGPGGLVNTALPGQGTTTAQTRSFEYFIPNGDGTFGLVSETRQHVAPISVGAPVLGVAPLSIEVVGEFVMRTIATGKPGLAPIGMLGEGASIEFSDPLITVRAAGLPVVGPVNLSDILGAGIHLPLAPIADISVGGPPRSIGSEAAPGPPVIAPDGTAVSAAYDLLQLSLLDLPGLAGVDLRVGHMESAATVPAGGIRCNIPVTKTAQPDPAAPGQDVTVTIQIPDPERFAIFFRCDLLNISATDTHRVVEGNPRFRIVSASNGGTISGNTVNWPNLGNYRRGDPPITLTVVLRIEGGAGLIEDIVDVSATLGNCDGGVVGQDIAGFVTGGFTGNGIITGRLVHRGPQVAGGGRGALPPTGGNTVPLIAGGAILVTALGVRQVVRRSGSVHRNS